VKKILKIKFGSHLYGTDTPSSDVDFKSVYIPEARDIILGRYKKTIQFGRKKEHCERNTKDDTDEEIFSLDRFLGLLMEGQTVALDMIFAPDEFCEHTENINIWRAIKLHRHELLTKNVQAFVGYARQQAAKYGIKGSRMEALKRTMEMLEGLPLHDRLSGFDKQVMTLVQSSSDMVSLEKLPLIEIVYCKGPNAEAVPHLHVCGRKIPLHATVKFAKEVFGKILDNYGQRARKAHLDGGVDWKALSHAVRVNGEANELLRTGHITFPRPDRETLIAIKTGQVPYEKVAEMIEQGLAELYEAQSVSRLPDKPNTAWADDLVFDVYSRVVKNNE
jgi:hypothetical protein